MRSKTFEGEDETLDNKGKEDTQATFNTMQNQAIDSKLSS